MAVKLTVSHEYSGLSDYWGGNGRRWDNDAGCAFAFYGAGTTLKDCVDQWVDDVWNGGDFEHNGEGRDAWEEVTSDDVRAAILDSLTEQGRADYDSGAIAECAAEYAAINDLWEQLESDGELDEGDRIKITGVDGRDVETEVSKITYHDDGTIRSVFAEFDGKTYRRDPEDVYICVEDDDCYESPIWVILIEVEQCSECGAGDEHVIDDICKACADKHGYDLTV
jgi:hypothetical protein